MENPIINIKIAIRKLAEEGVPVKKLIDATKEAEGILESYDEWTRKEIYGFLNRVLKDKNVLLLVADRIGDNIPSMIPSWIAYLKKQNNGAEEYTDFTIYHPLKNGKGEYECIPYSFYGSLTSFSEDKDLIDFLRTCFYTEEECNEWIEQQKEQKPVEWSEEDEEVYSLLDCILDDFKNAFKESAAGYKRVSEKADKVYSWVHNRLKSLRPQPKEERETMEIKYGGKVYQVHGVRDLPGGATGYIIEDEPGHYDCIINPEEVLGGGYGVKQNGSPYPTKEATFGWPHWKPSDEQMKALCSKLPIVKGDGDKIQGILETLYDDLKKL